MKGKIKRGRSGGRLKREGGLFEKRLNNGFTVRLSSQAYVHFRNKQVVVVIKGLNPWDISKSRLILIVRENEVLNRTVVDSDWRFDNLGWVAQSMVSFNHWLSSIKTNTLSRYLTLVNANHASNNWAQCGSHLQSQSELYHVSWWYYTLVIVLIGQIHRDVTGRLSVKPWCYWLWRLVISNCYYCN